VHRNIRSAYKHWTSVKVFIRVLRWKIFGQQTCLWLRKSFNGFTKLVQIFLTDRCDHSFWGGWMFKFQNVHSFFEIHLCFFQSDSQLLVVNLFIPPLVAGDQHCWCMKFVQSQPWNYKIVKKIVKFFVVNKEENNSLCG